jgi:HD superfamily phosphodiesterase
LVSKQEELLKNKLAREIKLYFAQDEPRIAHATKVVYYAEQIMQKEKGDPVVVFSAAYLHDIGIVEAGEKPSSTVSLYEELGSKLARNILEKLGAEEDLIEEVCDIIAHHHHPREEETINFKCLYDADTIVNLEDKIKEQKISPEKVKEIIEKKFFTDTGKELAKKVLLKEE